MYPLLKRILLHGGATAAMLAVIGFLFTELAGMWMNASPDRAPDAAPTSAVLRARVPLMMAFWGFVFVAVCELALYRLRGNRLPGPKPVERQSDDAEKLLNELLAQAESRMALEAESQKAAKEEEPQMDAENADNGKPPS